MVRFADATNSYKGRAGGHGRGTCKVAGVWPLPCLKPMVNCWFPSRFGFPTSDESANIPIIKQHNQSLLFFGSHSNKTTTHDQRHHLKLLAFQCELKLRPELVSWVSLRWNKTWKSQRVWDQKWSNSPHKACSLLT
jgi:hypothetical protein